MNAKLAKALRAAAAGKENLEQQLRIMRSRPAKPKADPKPRTRRAPLAKREREPAAPTWPATDNQRAQSRPLIVLGPNRPRDKAKREKPKSKAAKRMDRPSRVAIVDRGHQKLSRWFGMAS